MTNSPNEYTAQQAQSDAKLAKAKNLESFQSVLESVYSEIRTAAQQGYQYCFIQLEENESSRIFRASIENEIQNNNRNNNRIYRNNVFAFNVAIKGHKIIEHSLLMHRAHLTNIGQCLVETLRAGGYQVSLIDFPDSKLKITWNSDDPEERTLMIKFASEEDRTPNWPPKR